MSRLLNSVFQEERPHHYLLCVIGNQRSDVMEGQNNCVAWGLHNQRDPELASKPRLVGREGSTWGCVGALPPFWSRDLQKHYLLALLALSCFYFPFSFTAPHLILRLSGILVSDSNLLTWFLNQWLLNYKFAWFLCFRLFPASQHFSSCIHFFSIVYWVLSEKFHEEIIIWILVCPDVSIFCFPLEYYFGWRDRSLVSKYFSGFWRLALKNLVSDISSEKSNVILIFIPLWVTSEKICGCFEGLYMCVCVYVCVYICVCVCIYIYSEATPLRSRYVSFQPAY